VPCENRPTRWPYISVLAAAVLCYAALGLVLRALPTYVNRDLHGGGLAVGLAVGAPALTGALLRPVGGRLADRRKSAPVMLIGAAVMVFGALIAVPSSYALLLVSRLVVGAGEALMMSSAVRWLLRFAGEDRRGRALGHIGLANYAGLSVGPLLAQLLGLDHPSAWLWVVAAALPAPGALLVLIARRIANDVPSLTHRSGATSTPMLLRRTARPGLGLLLVNVGYVAILAFGATVVTSHGLHVDGLVVPVFGIGVIASRTFLAALPDRLGAVRCLVLAVCLEGAGLIVLSQATLTPLAIGALVVLAVGQGLAVPSLGLLALRDVPAEAHGAAAGVFFAYFDAGVGLGGPAVGLTAGLLNPAAALAGSGVAVIAAAPTALAVRRYHS
jgi:MFS family permease